MRRDRYLFVVSIISCALFIFNAFIAKRSMLNVDWHRVAVITPFLIIRVKNTKIKQYSAIYQERKWDFYHEATFQKCICLATRTNMTVTPIYSFFFHFFMQSDIWKRKWTEKKNPTNICILMPNDFQIVQYTISVNWMKIECMARFWWHYL